MDDQGVFFQIFGKIAAGTEFEFKFTAGILSEPGGDFDPADIIALNMVRTGFGNQYPVTVVQLVDFLCAAEENADIAFVTGKQGGKSGHFDFRRNFGSNFHDNLRIGDYQSRRLFQVSQHRFQIMLFGNNGDGVAVENFPQNLNLRQNQPAFGRRQVDRHDQYHGIAGFDQIAGQQGIFPEFRRCQTDDFRFQPIRVLSGCGGNFNIRQAVFPAVGAVLSACRFKVAFVEGDDERNRRPPHLFDDFLFFFFQPPFGNDNDRKVGFEQNFAGRFNP